MSLAFLLATSSLYCLPSSDYRAYVAPYHGMKETGYNRGPFIDSANRKYAYLGAPYCASSVSMILDRCKATTPKTRSARARAFIASNSVSARRVWEGKDTVPRNSLVIFTRKGGGHIEFHIETRGNVMRCFGFNTSPDGKAGSQWNGVWSGYKNREIKKSLSPYNVFHVTHFTPVTYDPKPRTRANVGVDSIGDDTNSPAMRYSVFDQHSNRAKDSRPSARYSIR